MSTHLLIVESPSKAKTIAKFLDKSFAVKSCFGHIRDLKKENMGVDVHNGFAPQYEIPQDKAKIVKELKQSASKADEVWLATDEDREGEAISWHLCAILKLDPEKTKRIVFHEITKKAILQAIEQPRNVNMDLVYAQQARRVLDRIVGFQLSPLLNRKLRIMSPLSAGRVQSVAVRLIVEREETIEAFQPESYYKIKAHFLTPGKETIAASGEDIDTFSGAQAFLEACKGATYEVAAVSVKPGKKTPPPPFTTSTLQQEAARKLGYSVSRTMSGAQKLYENGHITYMRTDSVTLSEAALTSIEKHIQTEYGQTYVQIRRFKNKNTRAQEAHEAIRPTEIHQELLPGSAEQKLYQLIRNRTLASQMADAQVENTHIHIRISTHEQHLHTKGTVITFEGFLKIYNTFKEEEEENVLPALKVQDPLQLRELSATERKTTPKARYSEGSLVKTLEELGIGRPSTYASIISTITKRNYVIRRDSEGILSEYRKLCLDPENQITSGIFQEKSGSEKGRFHPTDIGRVITQYLITHFKNVMDYHFTASIEENFDQIAHGHSDWIEVVRSFYLPFSDTITQVQNNTQENIGNERLLGTDEKSGRCVYARIGKYGPVVQIGKDEAGEKPLFAPIPPTFSVATIDLASALSLFSLPKTVGMIEGEAVTLKTGKFGPYAAYGVRRISLGKNIDPYQISDEEVLAIVQQKIRLPRFLGQYDNADVQVNEGPYGPYVLWQQHFCPLKKNTDLYTIPLSEAIAAIETFKEKRARQTLQSFPEIDAVLLQQRFGPVLKYKGKTYKIPKAYQDKIPKLTLEDIAQLTQTDKGKKKKSASR